MTTTEGTVSTFSLSSIQISNRGDLSSLPTRTFGWLNERSLYYPPPPPLSPPAPPLPPLAPSVRICQPISGRSISALQLAIDDENLISEILIQIDFEKVYDRVSHDLSAPAPAE